MRKMVYTGEQWRKIRGQVLVDVEDVWFVWGYGPRVRYRRVGARNSSPRLTLATFLQKFRPASEAGGPQVTARERWAVEFQAPAEKS